MSLVGNLEELGLGEILQIISMSRRSGVLSLKSRGHQARIIFHNGEVIRASSTTLQQNMGEVLIQKGVIDLPLLQRALSIQADDGYRQLLGTIMAERFGVSAEAIDAVVREQIEKVVYSLFAWAEGTFEFEMQKVADRDAAKMVPVQFMLQQGLNPQYLAMEGSRIIDEMRHRGEADEMPEAIAAPVAEGPTDLLPGNEVGVAPSIKVTAWMVMAVGGALLCYGITGLLNYYSRDWQAVLSEPVLEPVSNLSVFFRLGLIPWAASLSGLYLIWAAYRFWKRRKDCLSRLIEAAWSGVAVAVIYEAVEFGNWMRVSYSPTFSYYAAGIVSSLFWTVLLSAPFLGLLFHLKSDGISRENETSWSRVSL